MKRLFNNRTIENASSEKTLQQGRLANMRTLTLRRLFGLAGLTIMLGAVAFVAYGATIHCPTGTNAAQCVGTEFSDTIDDSGDTLTLQARGGDDTISLDHNGGSASEIDNNFGGPGDDRFLVRNTAAAEIAFGEDGDDSFKVMGSDPASKAEHTLDGGRGDDFFLIDYSGNANKTTVNVFDGPGADTILAKAISEDGNWTPVNVRLIADNEQDTVRLADGNDTIELQKGSGRDVIDCGGGSDDTLILNGNRKATDTHGNNLRKAALLGGSAQSNCETIIP